METSYNRKEFFADELNIPGLNSIGHNKATKVSNPLVDHIHEDCVELVVLIKGTESYNIAGTCYTVNGGEAFFSNLNEYHRSENSQGISEFYWFQLNMSVSDNFLGLDKECSAILRDMILSYKDHTLYVNKRCLSFIKEVFASIESNKNFYARGLFVSFLYHIFDTNNIKNNIKEISINKALIYINENIYNELTMENICSHCAISLSTLKHKFKEHTGVTPRFYINKLKMEIAKELLMQGRSVTETSMSLAFNSSDYFSVVFKKYNLVSPSEFKERINK